MCACISGGSRRGGSGRARRAWWTVGLCLLGLSVAGCSGATGDDRAVRPAAVAGSFYPGDPHDLDLVVRRLLDQVSPPPLRGNLVALLVPHAGYVYSGIVAALGWKMLLGREFATVYVLGTAHYAGLDGAVAWEGQAFGTPLGDYAVDSAAVRDLVRGCPDIRLYPAAWTQEHSVEVQVPFLQIVAPRAKLVPLIVGRCSTEQCRAIASALARQAKDRQALLVASSDLSHFPPQAEAARVDHAMLRALEDLDVAALDRLDRQYMSQGVPGLACTLCGLSAVEIVVLASRELGADQARLLRYANSGELGGDAARVVGYAAMAFLHGGQKPSAAAPPPESAAAETLSPEQQAQLLALARSAIARRLQAAPTARKQDTEPWLNVPRAVFVTLRENHRLRGCIGMTEARLPLAQATEKMALAAAFEDPRFPPLRAEELKRVALEISILSPLRRIQDPREIVMGQDGVVVRAGGRSGLFLPQVASETGWSRETFLDRLCSEKAGLAPDAWKNPRTELFVFTVQAFGEP